MSNKKELELWQIEESFEQINLCLIIMAARGELRTDQFMSQNYGSSRRARGELRTDQFMSQNYGSSRRALDR